ncbi:hypothetical protein PR048_000108 [Dryococelus australis]|uniref:Uncharacterized protein n=1 Tax=Dryococelus australis TaxID=614101 RepID=A0ABQ9IEN6_9NEOP|nr:hypothetical protein PR048_000108 [Dryococelus australis]
MQFECGANNTLHRGISAIDNRIDAENIHISTAKTEQFLINTHVPTNLKLLKPYLGLIIFPPIFCQIA